MRQKYAFLTHKGCAVYALRMIFICLNLTYFNTDHCEISAKIQQYACLEVHLNKFLNS